MLTIKLAFRNLFRNTRRTLLTSLLLALGLVALIFTDGLVNGMRKLMVDSVTTTIQGELQIHHSQFPSRMESEYYLDNVDEMTAILSADPSVSGYAVRTLSGGMISSPYNMQGGLIYGIDPGQESGVSKIRAALIEGEGIAGNTNSILLGNALAKQLETALGDRVVITMAKATTGEISQSLFRVSGIVHFGIREMDESFAFIHIDRAREALDLEGKAHEIAVRFIDPDTALKPDLPLKTQLQAKGRIVRNWMEFNPEIGSVIEMSQYSTAMIGAILFLLVSLGVINSMFMSIYERIYELGVVRAIGTSMGQVISLVFWEALILAIMSSTLGLLICAPLSIWAAISGIPLGEAEFTGIAISGNILPVFEASQFIYFPLYVVLLTLTASAYPAVYAGRIVPSEALHRSL